MITHENIISGIENIERKSQYIFFLQKLTGSSTLNDSAMDYFKTVKNRGYLASFIEYIIQRSSEYPKPMQVILDSLAEDYSVYKKDLDSEKQTFLGLLEYWMRKNKKQFKENSEVSPMVENINECIIDYISGGEIYTQQKNEFKKWFTKEKFENLSKAYKEDFKGFRNITDFLEFIQKNQKHFNININKIVECANKYVEMIFKKSKKDLQNPGDIFYFDDPVPKEVISSPPKSPTNAWLNLRKPNQHKNISENNPK